MRPVANLAWASGVPVPVPVPFISTSPFVACPLGPPLTCGVCTVTDIAPETVFPSWTFL